VQIVVLGSDIQVTRVPYITCCTTKYKSYLCFCHRLHMLTLPAWLTSLELKQWIGFTCVI